MIGKKAAASPHKSLLANMLYKLRDLRSKPLFAVLEKHCSGKVLDVGGWDFYKSVQGRGLRYSSWTTLEYDPKKLFEIDDPRFSMIAGDGCNMPFPDLSFDVVLNLQVLEHVFDPLKMVQEIERVLRPGGTGIFLIPQTSNLHMLPHHYYNFTIYWIKEAMRVSGFEIIQLNALGGAWSTIASRLFYMLLQGAGQKNLTYGQKRSVLFYLLSPLMLLYVVINLPICMLFSLADLEEEPNNHLVIVRKK